MAVNQAYLFLIFTLNGVFIGLIFDFFRILRKTFKTINIVTYIEDIIFWILTGISIIFCMYNFSDGSLRLFMFLGLGFGIITYMLTLSKLIIKIAVFLISIIKKILKKVLKIIIIPTKFIYKIISKPVYIMQNKIHNFATKNIQKAKIKLKNKKKIVKNVKNF